MPTIPVLAFLAWLALAGGAFAQDVKGSLTANGKSAALAHAVAVEVDSATEKGFMDVFVVLSDRKLAAAQARDVEKLERMMRDEGLVALVVRLNPDAKVMSASPLHPAMRTIISSAAFVQWQPQAFDEKRVAGRFWTEGVQKEFGQQWSYDATFAAPIALDPAAKTVPKK
jgi:hypothetical protein